MQGTFTRYKIKVENKNLIDSEIFAEAPDLPACGKNKKSARSWVTINETDTDKKLNHFCSLNKIDQLGKLWFDIENTEAAPNKLNITTNDRKTKKKYCSNDLYIL